MEPLFALAGYFPVRSLHVSFTKDIGCGETSAARHVLSLEDPNSIAQGLQGLTFSASLTYPPDHWWEAKGESVMDNNKKQVILLVEDEPLIALSEAKTLRRYAYEVITTRSGEEAITLVDKRHDIDLILMDINLGKGIDGTEAATAILKKHNIPLVFISSHTEREIVERTEGITSYGYIVKDSGETVLIACVKMAFRLFESRVKEQESDAFRKRIFESSKIPIIIMEARGKTFVDCNPAAVAIVGLTSKEQLLGQSHGFFSPPTQHGGTPSFERGQEYIDKALADGQVTFEWHSRRPSGELWDAEIQLMSFSSNGQPFLQFTLEDITERKRASEQLKSSEERFRSVFQHSASGMALVAFDFSFLGVNESFCRMLGYSESELLSRKVDDVTMPEDRAPGREIYRKALAGEVQKAQFEKRYLRKDGSVVWGLVSTTVLRDLHGASLHFVSQIQDVTERKMAEETLRASEERFRLLFEHSALGMVVVSPDFRFLRANSSFCRMLGYSEAELSGRTFQDVTIPDDRATGGDLVRRVLAGEMETFQFEKRYIHKNGTVVWGMVSSTLIRDSQNSPLHFVTQIQDITERKRAELALRMSEAQSRDLWGATVEGIAIHDQGIILEVNEPMCRLFGYTREQVLGKSILAFSSPEMRDKIRENFASGTEGRFEASAVRNDGTRMELEVYTKQVLFRGNMVRMAATLDITERKQAERALKESEEKFSSVFRGAPVWIAIVRLSDGKFMDVNEEVLHASGFSREEVLGHTAIEIGWITPEDRLRLLGEIGKHGRVEGLEMAFQAKGGRRMYGWVNAERIVVGGCPCLLLATADITQRKQAEDKIKHLLDEKTLLLKEVHHRIKNNVASIESLLNLQSAAITDPEALSLVQDAISRVRSIRILYETLLITDDYKILSVRSYFENLVETFASVLRTGSQTRIRIESQIDDFLLDGRIIWPLGMIVNELLTNAMKYAFVEREQGHIEVAIIHRDGAFTVVVQDDGVGIPFDFDITKAKSLGFVLVDMLCKQIGARFHIERRAGTRCVLELTV